MTTVHTFAKLGFRTMPIGYIGCLMLRNDKGKKYITLGDKTLSFVKAMPTSWTTLYGKTRTVHNDTPLGGLICGTLANKQKGEIEVIALDCDNQAAWDLFTSLDQSYLFKFKSIGKPGGTILYQLPEKLKDLKQYSIKANGLTFEYMAQRESGPNAMVYLPTTANKTKDNIAKGAELTEPPEMIVSLLKSLKPMPVQVVHTSTGLDKSNLPYNAPLVKQFVSDANGGGTFKKVTASRAEKVYRVFTPKKFRQTEWKEQGWLHPNSPEVLSYGSWSEYIVGVSAIAGADPSIDVKLYTNFIQAINAQTDDPMSAKRLVAEVCFPMTHQKAKIHGIPIWKYNEKWDQQSHTIVNQYGETLEYFVLENGANVYIEYNHIAQSLIEIKGLAALRDQIYTRDTDPQQEKPAANIVKKLKLVHVNNSIKEDLGLFTNDHGHQVLNTAEPVLSLRILRHPEDFPIMYDKDSVPVQAFELFLAHLLNEDRKAILFLKQMLAYHGRHLNAIPVILYIVGVGGAGKSIFANLVEQLFGANTTRRPSGKQCSSTFNDFLENTAVLILTETSDMGSRDREGIKAVLKTVTGEKSIDIESKGKKLKPNVPLFALPILLANDPWYQEDSGDRRLFSIMPKTTLPESRLISNFEKTTGVRIIPAIEKGIQHGVISKYLSKFCPDRLPEVPLTQDKRTLSAEQLDPIMVVKNVVANKDWLRLFDLMQEHNIDLFFTAMHSSWLRDKDALFKQQLVDLAIGIRGTGFHPSDAEISRAFTVRWLPLFAKQYRPVSITAKKLGYVKWSFPIEEAFNEWKLLGLQE